MRDAGGSWRDLAAIARLIEERLEVRLPGELLALTLLPMGRSVRVVAEVASETARSLLLRELAAVPGAPHLEDEIVVTGYFEPATDDEWFFSRQPARNDGGAPSPPDPAPIDRRERAIVRHPVLEATTPLVAGTLVNLMVDLRVEAEAAGSPAFELAVLPDGWHELVVDVIATSPSFLRPAQGSICVFETGGSRGAELSVPLRDGLAAGVAVEVSLTFFEKGRHCGDWTTVMGEIVGIPGTRLTEFHSTPAVAIGRAAEAPTLTVIIRRMGENDLDWLWQVPHGVAVGHAAITGSTRMNDPTEYGRTLIRECPLMPASSVKRRMASIGEDVWSHVPSEFKATYAALRERYGPEFPIQLVLDEHGVPWELMVPDAEDGRPLYLTHPVARWPVARGSDRPFRLPAGSVCSFVPEYTGNGTLPAARREGEWLEANLRAIRRRPSTIDFLALMECSDAPDAVSMVHFAGHGKAADADGTAGLRMEDGWLVAADLNSATTKLGKRDRPMMLLNACEMADVGSDLRWVSGWAPHLVRYGFGAVVAPLWRVQDEAAHDVVIDGLGRMYRGGEGLGAAFAHARAAYADDSSAAYAFVAYGDVLAAVLR